MPLMSRTCCDAVQSLIERSPHHARRFHFRVANGPRFVILLCVKPISATLTASGLEAGLIRWTNFTPLLCPVVFVGGPALGPSLDF
jgi:hypothetical protein